MDSNSLAFVISATALLALCWLWRAQLAELSLGLAVVLTPLAHLSFMPQNTFGIPGISLVNVVLGVAAVAVLRRTGVPEAVSSLHRYFTWPLVVFMLLFAVAVARTAVDVDSLLPRAPTVRPTVFRVVMLDGVLSIKFLVVGYLVALYGIHHRSLAPARSALVALPIVLLPVVLGYFLAGALSSGPGESSMSLGRDAISGHLGIHANYLGRMALYLLLFLLTARRPAGPRTRWVAILCSVALIELSFSRTAWLVAPPMVAWVLRGRPRSEWLGVAACTLAVTLCLLPYVTERSEYGFEPTPGKRTTAASEPAAGTSKPLELLHRVSAGRTGNIWPTVLPNFFAHPIVGQGLYSVWKPVDAKAKRLVYDHPHNAYLEVALDMGIVGLVALGWLLWSFWQVGRHYRPLRYLLVAWMVMALTGDSFYPQQQTALNWSVLGMGVAAAAVPLGSRE